MELPFGTELIQSLADSRSEPLTRVAQLLTFLGDLEGYVLLISLVYAAFDKRLAVRLAVLTIASMSLNHLLKMLIMMPRPFVLEGTWQERWAVSAAKAEVLATEYSTPSGHAMAGGAFYAYLYASVSSRPVRAACVALLLLTGLSRPYLGVHYLEDVLIGWPIGIALGLAAWRYGARIGGVWGRLSPAWQLGLVVAATFLLWLVTRALSDWKPDGQPLEFVSYLGFLAGVVIAEPLERRRVGFDPRSSTRWHKLLRFALGVGLVIGTLELLDLGFAALAPDASPLGIVLRFVRYALASIAGLFLAPLLFVRLGWANVPEHTSAPALFEPERGEPGDPLAALRRCIEQGCDALLLDSHALPAAFFDLSTGVAGELAQKLVNYGVRMAAVVPDLAGRPPRFREFAREANAGRQLRFFATRREAVDWLAAAAPRS